MGISFACVINLQSKEIMYQSEFHQRNRASGICVSRDLLQGFGLHKCVGYLEKSEIYKDGLKKGV
jgi:hypothetical protein